MATLVTGASGFIGREISKYGSVRKVSRRSSANINCDNTFIIDELNASTDWNGAFDSVKCVIHLAGVAHADKFSLLELQKVNVDGTLHLAQESVQAGVKRFVFVSSIIVNGTNTKKLPFDPSSSIEPHNAYAKSKYMAEVGLKEISERTGLELVIVRPTLVYGLDAPGNFGLLTKLVDSVPFLPFGLMKNKRDFIAVQNLADLLMTCAKHENAAGHTFLASDGQTVSIKEFTNAISEGLGKSIVQLPIPSSLMRLCAGLVGKSALAEQLLGDLQVDSSNIKEILGWVPPYAIKQAMASLSDIKND